MVLMKEAVIVSGARTAIGNFGGSLQDVSASQLGATAIKGALKKIGLRPSAVNPELDKVEPKAFQGLGLTDLEKKYYDWDKSLKEVNIDEVIMGNVLQAGQGQNPARQAQIYAGIPKEVNAYTVNKICGSSMKTVALAAQAIKAGDAEVIIAGGIESMSNAPFYLPKARTGYRMGRLNDANADIVDGMIWDGLWELFYGYHMGVTAENIASKYNISRKEQDEFSVMSNLRAAAACKDGTFKDEIVPVEIKVKREVKLFDCDEHPRADCSMDTLAKLPTVFKKDGTITAGNASAITDAGAAVVMMSAETAQKYGLRPIAYVKAYASGGIDPAYMGMGVVPAVNKALKLAGLSLKDIDVFELNEAFASQALGVMKELGISTDKTNLHGGGISLGHPIGCTGTRIIVTLMHEMARRNLRYGLAALCIGGGQGMCVILERK
jgi:acetyl-CoA C-acetyltransferase